MPLPEEDLQPFGWREYLRALHLYMDFVDLVTSRGSDEPPIGTPLDMDHARVEAVRGLALDNTMQDVLRAVLGDAEPDAPEETDDGTGSTWSGPAEDSDSDGSSYGSISTRAQAPSASSGTTSSDEFEIGWSARCQARKVAKAGAGSSGRHSSWTPALAEQLPESPFSSPSSSSAGATTLSVYYVPKSLTQADLTEKWPVDGSYDFLHLRNSRTRVSRVRLAIINFLSAELAEAFKERWHGSFLSEQHASSRPLTIVTASVQGRDLNLMLVLTRTLVPPVVLLQGERQRDEDVREMVRLAKRGLFRWVI